VYFSGEATYLETVCLERDDIRVVGTVEGPAIVSEWDSTIIVPPRATATVSDAGDLILSLAP
jgi:N-methylhydantoinase A